MLSLADAEREHAHKRRGKPTFEQHRDRDAYVAANQHRPMFRRHLRMSYDSFCLLLEKIRPHLPIQDEKMSALRGGIVIPELYATI